MSNVIIILYIYIINSTGPNTDPCGIPDRTSSHSDFYPFKTTRCRRFIKKFSIQLSNFPSKPYDLSLSKSLL